MNMNTNKYTSLKSILFALFFLLVSFIFSSVNAQASTPVVSTLTTKSKLVQVGDVVTVNLTVNTVADIPIYSALVNLVYDNDILEFKQAQMSNEWMYLSGSKYEVTDTNNGLITRAGGYPNGILGQAPFITYTFRAIKKGKTDLLIVAGQAYDKNNNDEGLTSTNLELEILEDSSSKNVDEDKNEGVTFDMSLSVKGDNAFYKQDDYVFDIYHKKENKVQQAITKIWVFDDDANLHFEDQKQWITDSDTVLNFTIPANTLEEGNYRIISKVRYEDNVEKTINEKSVGVLSNGKTWFTQNRPLFWPFFLTLVFIAILHHIFTEREIYRSLLKTKKTRNNIRRN